MAILKAPSKPPKNETLQIPIEEHVRSRVAKYAEFIYSSLNPFPRVIPFRSSLQEQLSAIRLTI